MSLLRRQRQGQSPLIGFPGSLPLTLPLQDLGEIEMGGTAFIMENQRLVQMGCRRIEVAFPGGEHSLDPEDEPVVRGRGGKVIQSPSSLPGAIGIEESGGELESSPGHIGQ